MNAIEGTCAISGEQAWTEIEQIDARRTQVRSVLSCPSFTSASTSLRARCAFNGYIASCRANSRREYRRRVAFGARYRGGNI